MGKGGALSDGVVKKIMLSYMYVAIWIFLSFTVIVYNKYILDRKLYNWPFPISLTMIHMAFCSSLAFAAVRVFRLVEPAALSRRTYLSSVVPIGALYSLSLWLSNSAYIYLSVSFIQMLKALMPVAVYSIGILLKKDAYKSTTMSNMLAISVGVAIAAYGEAKYDSWGVFLQLGAVVFEATRLQTAAFHFDFLIFGTNCLCAFALNLAVFLLVGKTSALTMNVAGVVKDWLLIAFSWSVIKDTVTPVNLIGYGLAFLGVAYYNHSKLQALKAKEAQKKTAAVDEEAAKLITEREGDGKKGDSQA
ncbi:hypothetical protein SASPL_157255 [Salvia splendens]|uniref:Sugar phosphate transporter domain-containing protein n=1 Tax=Salvia splendens TaxID=180675 RepID=A0A8X8VV82_SALSN|nr:hypothetical protein SASPL_157255 [Salvia splendens]